MKKRLISILLLVAIISSLFAGCSFSDIEKALVKDDGKIDPATVMVADLLKKTVSNDAFTLGDITYVLYNDNTASVKEYKGEAKDVEIASTIDVNGTAYTVVGIDNKAFYRNEKIENLVISDTVQVVGNFAFRSCKNLKEITIGKSVGYIGVSAFQSDKAPQNNRKERLDENGKVMLNSKGDPIYYDGVGNLQHINWLGAPKVIAEKAFYLNDKLDEIVLPQGVEEIGEWAFAKCSGAKKTILPEGLKKLGAYSFIKNISVKEIVVPGSCEIVSQSAFYRNMSAETITVGEGIKELCQGAFEECYSVKSVDLPKSVTKLGKYAFYNCTALDEISVNSEAEINKDAFRDDDNVKINKF